MLEKWKKAVIHLECATDSEHFYDRIKRMDEQRALLEKGEITQGEFGDAIASRSRDLRYHGTALFITHADRRYLLTARHMVWDEVAAKRELQEEVERTSTWPENMQSHMVQSGVEQAKNRIFNIIFRVPSLNELFSRGVDSHLWRQYKVGS